MSFVCLEARSDFQAIFLSRKGKRQPHTSSQSESVPAAPIGMELYPGQIFVAPDGPYKNRIMTLKGPDPRANPEQDRWIIVSDDDKEWGAPGARLREVLAQQADKVLLPEIAAPAGPAGPDAAITQTQEPQLVPPEAGEAQELAALVAPVPNQVTPASAEQPALDFAQTPIKLLIQLWPDEGEGRTAWIGADLPDHNPVLTALTVGQVRVLMQPLAGVLAQLEAEFPERRAKIVSALASEQHTSSVPLARTASTPTARSKPAARAIKGTPLTTVSPGTDKSKQKTGPSPQQQAYLASLQQTEMFPPTQQAAAPAAPTA